MATASNLIIMRGDDIIYTVTLVNDDGTNPNITGYTFYFTVKEKFTDSDNEAKIAKTVTSLSDPTHGTMTFTLTHTDTNLAPKTYVYDIQFKDGSSLITTVLYGEFTILPDVTKRTT